jgi:hypothetical protein
MKVLASFLKALGLFAFLSLLGLASCEKKITTADAAKIRPGMTVGQVESILGKSSSSTSATVGADPPVKETRRLYGDGGNSVIVRYDGNDQVISLTSGIAP